MEIQFRKRENIAVTLKVMMSSLGILGSQILGD